MKSKVPITARALLQRINRKLKDDGRAVKKTRGGLAGRELGEYYMLNFISNAVVSHHKDINLEALGRELGVLEAWEKLEEK